MRVTDEMVAAAMAAFEAYFQDPAHERQCDECNGEGCTPVGVDADRDWCPKCGGPGTLNDATEEGGIRASLGAALSHAAGQEAVFWITQDDVNRAKYQGDNVIACPAVGDAPEGAVMLYPTPAQPPASAEVGIDD